MKRLAAVIVSLALILSLFSVSYAEDKKVLHWFIEGEVTTMDTSKVYDTISGEAVFLFADPLYRLDENADPQPNLAVALPEISEDGTVYTITIRDNAKYRVFRLCPFIRLGSGRGNQRSDRVHLLGNCGNGRPDPRGPDLHSPASNGIRGGAGP